MPPPSRGKSALFWALTLAGPLLFVVLGLEVGLRVARRRQAPASDAELRRRLAESRETEVRVVSTGNLKGLVQPSDVPDLVYELKPHRSWLFGGKKVRTNEAGFRGRDFPKAKPQGSRRVVGVGDSVMFGWGVEEEESYTSLLETALNRRGGGPVEVLNLAVPGYNTIQERAAFEYEGLPLDPDLVLINYCLNDWSAPFFLPNPQRKGMLIEKTVLFEELTRRLHRDAEAEYSEMQGMDKVEAALERIRGLTAARDIPVVFFIYPLPLKPAARDDLAKMATKRGFRYVDMYAAFGAYYKERGLRGLEDLMLSPRDSHPNPEGHRLIARTLEDALLSLLPGSPPPRRTPPGTSDQLERGAVLPLRPTRH